MLILVHLFATLDRTMISIFAVNRLKIISGAHNGGGGGKGKGGGA